MNWDWKGCLRLGTVLFGLYLAIQALMGMIL